MKNHWVCLRVNFCRASVNQGTSHGAATIRVSCSNRPEGPKRASPGARNSCSPPPALVGPMVTVLAWSKNVVSLQLQVERAGCSEQCPSSQHPVSEGLKVANVIF